MNHVQYFYDDEDRGKLSGRCDEAALGRQQQCGRGESPARPVCGVAARVGRCQLFHRRRESMASRNAHLIFDVIVDEETVCPKEVPVSTLF